MGTTLTWKLWLCSEIIFGNVTLVLSTPVLHTTSRTVPLPIYVLILKKQSMNITKTQKTVCATASSMNNQTWLAMVTLLKTCNIPNLSYFLLKRGNAVPACSLTFRDFGELLWMKCLWFALCLPTISPKGRVWNMLELITHKLRCLMGRKWEGQGKKNEVLLTLECFWL